VLTLLFQMIIEDWLKLFANNFKEYPGQRCQTHFSRNLLDKVSKQHRKHVHTRLKDLYNSPTLKEAYKRNHH